MRPRPLLEVETYRVKEGKFKSTADYGNNGMFIVPYDRKTMLSCVISDQLGWDHVSVSVIKKNRCATWEEMCYVKNMFFSPNELVIQFHPPAKDYINLHNWVLHMWRPHGIKIPMPPKVFV